MYNESKNHICQQIYTKDYGRLSYVHFRLPKELNDRINQFRILKDLVIDFFQVMSLLGYGQNESKDEDLDACFQYQNFPWQKDDMQTIKLAVYFRPYHLKYASAENKN